LPILENFEGGEDVSNFIFCKVESLIVQNAECSEGTEQDGIIFNSLFPN
jgi:hypothetical protein